LSACERCGDSGFEIVAKDGREFARPCACRRPARRGDFVRDCRIPARYEECSLASFHVEHRPLRAALETCLQYCNGYPHLGTTEEGLGLLFIGNTGVGKTHLAVSVLRELYERKGVHGQFWDFRDLMREIKRSYDPEIRTSEYEVLAPVVGADVLLFDDLGSARFTEWMDDTLFYILNARYAEKRPTIVTTNYVDIDPDVLNRERMHALTGVGDPEEFKDIRFIRHKEYFVERIGAPLRSRLIGMCKVIRLDAPDNRAAGQESMLAAIRRSGR
jgi:DNA replication protein DnaC